MVCCSLKTINKLNKAKEKERQIKSKQTATIAIPSNSLILSALAPRAKTNPFASLKVLLLLPKV
jgi:hypothetical protein